MAMVALGSGCSKSDDNPTVTPSDPKLDSLYAGIERLADSVLGNTHVPGMVVGVWIPSKNIEHVFCKGISAIGNNAPMSQAMLFRIGSITKTFVTTVALQLVDEGRLNLDEKLSKYYPDITESDKITVRMLMNMTSGICSYSESEQWLSDWHSNTLRKWTTDDLISYVKDKPLLFEPGASFHYSNTNIILLGEIISKITSQTPAQYLKERIFDRLGLASTYYPDGPTFPAGKEFAHGTLFDKQSNNMTDIAEKYDPSFAGAAGAIISNVSDVHKYVTALAKGDLLSAASQTERLKTFNFPGTADGYGLGIYRFKNWLGHNGEVPGYESSAYANPVDGASIVILYNMVDESETDALCVSIRKLVDAYLSSK